MVSLFVPPTNAASAAFACRGGTNPPCQPCIGKSSVSGTWSHRLLTQHFNCLPLSALLDQGIRTMQPKPCYHQLTTLIQLAIYQYTAGLPFSVVKRGA